MGCLPLSLSTPNFLNNVSWRTTVKYNLQVTFDFLFCSDIQMGVNPPDVRAILPLTNIGEILADLDSLSVDELLTEKRFKNWMQLDTGDLHKMWICALTFQFFHFSFCLFELLSLVTQSMPLDKPCWFYISAATVTTYALIFHSQCFVNSSSQRLSGCRCQSRDVYIFGNETFHFTKPWKLDMNHVPCMWGKIHNNQVNKYSPASYMTVWY